MTRHWRETLNLYRGPAEWYKISNSARGAEVTVYDEIGLFGVTAQDFVRDIGNIKGPISLRLNSPGGEVFDGLAIYNALRQRPDVSVSVDGIAASIASVIAQAASPGKLSIASTGSMMIHDGFSICTGNAQEMRKLADVLDEQSDVIAGVYAQRTGKPASFWRDQMKDETWFTAQKAVDAGLADKVTNGGPPVNQFDLSMFHNATNTTANDKQLSSKAEPHKSKKKGKNTGSAADHIDSALLQAVLTASLKGGGK